MGTFVDITNQTFGKWTVLRRAENALSGRARWLCRCECGNEGVVRADHLRNGRSSRCQTCGVAVAHAAARLSDECVTYKVVHERLHAARGAASAHLCISCASAASQWAYQHTAGEAERLELVVNRFGEFLMAFSASLDDYASMCRSCHLKLDRQKAEDRELVLGLSAVEEKV